MKDTIAHKNDISDLLISFMEMKVWCYRCFLKTACHMWKHATDKCKCYTSQMAICNLIQSNFEFLNCIKSYSHKYLIFLLFLYLLSTITSIMKIANRITINNVWYQLIWQPETQFILVISIQSLVNHIDIFLINSPFVLTVWWWNYTLFDIA